MYDEADRLLYVLSGRGEMRWDSFKKAFNTLLQQRARRATGGSPLDPQLSLLKCTRAFEALGHCDFDFVQSNRVFVGPPLLARLPRSGAATGVLSGARTPTLVAKLRERAPHHRCRVTVVPPAKSSFGVPTCIQVEAYSSDRVSSLSTDLGIGYSDEPPAWQFAQFSASVDEYTGSLEWLPATEPNWREAGFDPQELRFIGLTRGHSRVRLSRHELHGRWTHALWTQKGRATVDLDWGRYAVARDQAQQLIAYDNETFIFALPVAAPAPKPICRALGLSSGRSPERAFMPKLAVDISESRRLFDLFQGVPQSIAEHVATKLGQCLHFAKITPGDFKHE